MKKNVSMSCHIRRQKARGTQKNRIDQARKYINRWYGRIKKIKKSIQIGTLTKT